MLLANRYFGGLAGCLILALYSCPQPTGPAYVPLTPTGGARDPGIQVQISGGSNGTIQAAAGNQGSSQPAAPSQAMNNSLITVLVSANDVVGGVQEVEVEMERRTCLADGNGGAYTADTGNAGTQPLVQTIPPTKNGPSGPTVPVAADVLATVNVAQDLQGSYEVDYGFLGGAQNLLPKVRTVPIYFYATADNKPRTHGCYGPPFGPA